MAKYPRLAVAISVSCVSLTLCAPSVAAASSSIPKYAQKVAGGQAEQGPPWSIWIFGHHHADQCWATKTGEGGSSSEEALCGFSVPARPWQLAAKGTFGSGQGQESMLFFLARENVISLKVQVENDHSSQSWAKLRTHRLTSEAAKSAQIDPNFSYAVGTISGRLTCVGRVIAKTRSGKKISRGQSRSCSSRSKALSK
jgi:hypothetical protein